MPNLNCSVSSCTHNKSQMCCLCDISVSGASAKVNDETCCSSFALSGASNSMQSQTPDPNTTISCNAKTCKHNNGTSCVANTVAIGGECESTNCSQTKCSTFCCCK